MLDNPAAAAALPINTAQTRANHVWVQEAARSLTSVLAPIEKRTLIWLARRLPSCVDSDHLTTLALIGMAAVGGSYWLARLTPIGLPLAVAGLAINWFGDSLDGTLARVRHQQRPRYGFYIDHVVDAVGAVFLFAGLGASGHMGWAVAAGLLVTYLLLLVETFLATHTRGTFTMSHFMIGPTELRILLAVGTLVLLVHPMAEISGRNYRLFDVGGVIGIGGMIATLLRAIAVNARALHRAEPRPARRND
jgi:phosphatidylglycerophosphate synthase